MNTKTIYCPYNSDYRVELDKGQVIDDNPGEGTPAMVYGPHGSCGTFYAAQGEGELACGDTVHVLPSDVSHWLNSIEDEVDEFLY